MIRTGKGWMALLLCVALLPGLAAAEEADGTDARMDALEARIIALEAQLEAILAGDAQEATEHEAQPFGVGESLKIGDGCTITISSYETGTNFRYTPGNGMSALSITAKGGYRLLCVYMTIDNTGRQAVGTAKLVDSVLQYGREYTNKAQETFFYRNSKGAYASGLKTIGAGATVEGCLLFAVPDTVDVSGEQVAIRMAYGDTVYECVLRPAGSVLSPAEAATTTSSF